MANVELRRGLRRVGVDDLVLLDAAAALETLGTGDVAIVRLDVLPTLDGVEPGFETLPALEAAGVRLLNRPEALLRAHDKLLTGLVLARAGVPHPATGHLLDPEAPLPLEPPFVLKPRFGSWGVDVVRCMTGREARARLLELSGRPWFRAHGVLVQELVAGDRVVGAVERRAQPGEWRTNVSVGASRTQIDPRDDERGLALAAVAALGLDLVGVDVMRGERGPVVIELNGAVDFDSAYSLRGDDVYRKIAESLSLVSLADPVLG